MEAWFIGGEKLHVKGKSCKQGDDAYSGAITFLKEGHYYISVSDVSGTTSFTIKVQKGRPVRTCKLSLVGATVDAVKDIEETLKQELKPVQDSRTLFNFPGRDLAIEFWGSPKLLKGPNRSVEEAISLSSVTDEGVLVFVWDKLSR